MTKKNNMGHAYICTLWKQILIVDRVSPCYQGISENYINIKYYIKYYTDPVNHLGGFFAKISSYFCEEAPSLIF